MLNKSIQLAALVSLAGLFSACVTTSEFAEYKQQVDQRFTIVTDAFTSADKSLADIDDVLLCESRVDAYTGAVGADEVDPTRRDEPSGTRRDLAACEAEFDAVTNGNHNACETEIFKCYDNSPNTPQQCRVCTATCLNTGSWPAACPLP